MWAVASIVSDVERLLLARTFRLDLLVEVLDVHRLVRRSLHFCKKLQIGGAAKKVVVVQNV